MGGFQKHKAFYLNTVWQYGLQIIKYILPMLVMPYLTRVLEPSGYAVYAYVVSFMAFAQTIVDFGFNLSGVKQIADARGDATAQSSIVGSITQARLVLCVLTAFGCAAIGSFIPIIRENALYASFAYLAVCGRSLAPDFLFQGHEQMGPLTTRYLISKSVFVATVFVFVHSASDLLWVPALDILTSAIALAWSFAVARRRFGVGVVWVHWREAIHELARSAYYCVSNMASTALSGAITLVIGIAITEPDQVAYWSVAMSAIGAVQSLYTPIVDSLYPHMVVGKDYSFAKKMLFLSIPFILVGSVVFYFLSDFIILVLGGHAYAGGAYVLKLLSPIVPLSFYSMFLGWPVIGSAGNVKELTRTTIISSVAGIVSLLVLIASGFASIVTFAICRSLVELVLCVLRVHCASKVLWSKE